MNRLKSKVAIVTRAALGLGRATVVRMAEEGACVAIFDMLDEGGQALAAELSGRGLTARFWHCDVSKESEVARVIGEVATHFGRLDVLVNNAGVAGVNKPTHEVTEAEWDWVQGINVKGVFFCTKHAIAHLRRAGSGSIINLSSVYGLVGAPDLPPSLPRFEGRGAADDQDRRDAVCARSHPGELDPSRLHLDPDGAEASGRDGRRGSRTQGHRLHPLGHMGEPDDIAWGAVYPASDEAKFVTGAELVIDGGYTAH